MVVASVPARLPAWLSGMDAGCFPAQRTLRASTRSCSNGRLTLVTSSWRQASPGSAQQHVVTCLGG